MGAQMAPQAPADSSGTCEVWGMGRPPLGTPALAPTPPGSSSSGYRVSSAQVNPNLSFILTPDTQSLCTPRATGFAGSEPWEAPWDPSASVTQEEQRGQDSVQVGHTWALATHNPGLYGS